MDQGITYAPRTAIKSQVLADFVAEWTEIQTPSAPEKQEYWTMHFDGSLMKARAGAGLVFISPLGVRMRYMIRLHFPASNNVAEYEALLNGLRIAIELGIRRLDVRGDSQLVVEQVMKEWSCHDPKMAAYCNEVRKLEDKFDGLELNHIARRFNEAADELAKAASGRKPVPDGVFISDQFEPSVRCQEPGKVGDAPPVLGPGADPDEARAPSDPSLEVDPSDPEVMEIDTDPAAGPDPPPDWRTPYLDYLIRETLPKDKTEARRIARRAKTFVIINQELYKRSHTGILQRCIPIEQGRALIHDIHAGACGHHAAPRTLVGNAFRQGFYWPTAVADATHVVRTCEGCQFFARQTHMPAQALQTIPITWPFAVWGLDLVGPFKKAPGGFTHLLVAIDKFSKWIEARPIAQITSEQAARFFTDIIHRFGSPTPSSRTTARNLPGRSSSGSATTTTSEWTGRPWRTPARMGRLNEPTA
ncbi:putative prpol [Panicum miliaceum]|uniref:Prpol n=1 Tax=Panicum miliaceum TaxID=4540 RepID=A0A3L6RVS4_PANMI|nr:putative prpol [Panicum miliaceum]